MPSIDRVARTKYHIDRERRMRVYIEQLVIEREGLRSYIAHLQTETRALHVMLARQGEKNTFNGMEGM